MATKTRQIDGVMINKGDVMVVDNVEYVVWDITDRGHHGRYSFKLERKFEPGITIEMRKRP